VADVLVQIADTKVTHPAWASATDGGGDMPARLPDPVGQSLGGGAVACPPAQPAPTGMTVADAGAGRPSPASTTFPQARCVPGVSTGVPTAVSVDPGPGPGGAGAHGLAPTTACRRWRGVGERSRSLSRRSGGTPAARPPALAHSSGRQGAGRSHPPVGPAGQISQGGSPAAAAAVEAGSGGRPDRRSSADRAHRPGLACPPAPGLVGAQGQPGAIGAAAPRVSPGAVHQRRPTGCPAT